MSELGATRSRRLLIALGINLGLVVAQLIAGLTAKSTGLLADAGHNFADIAALGVSLIAVQWLKRPRSEARSFGNHRATILAALANSVALALVTVLIVIESVIRLIHPIRVHAPVVVVVAAIAMLANLVAARALHDKSHDLNMRANLWHMLSDVASSSVVLVAGLIILTTRAGRWDRVDPIASLVVALLIVAQAVRLSRASIKVLLESTPTNVDLEKLRRAITEVGGVSEVHDLHVWSLSSEVRALSAHLVLTGHPTLEEAQVVAGHVRGAVSGPFQLAHSTFELECERCVDDHGDPCEMDEVPPGLGKAFSHG